MNINKIPETFGGFDQQIALESLSLIKEAQMQFQRAKDEQNYDWEADTNSIFVEGKEYKRLTNLGFAQYFALKRKRVPFGFIVQREDTKDIYVVFRGTSNEAEWISNFKFMQSSYKECDNPTICKSTKKEIKGKIHYGFYTTYTRPDLGRLIDSVYNLNRKDDFPSMEDKIEDTLKNRPANSSLFVTGHSLGGALATISTLHIHMSEEIEFEPILYSFASSRVGDIQFGRYFENLECYRIANSEDIVQKVPLPISLLASARLPGKSGATSIAASNLSRFNYHHIGIPIYFTQGTGTIAENHSLLTYKDALSTRLDKKALEIIS